MESARTISELKSAFIRRQLRILSVNLEPNENWREYALGAEAEDLSEKVVEDVLRKLNAALKQHNRVVYSTQAVHHVAQQISSLYWSTVVRENQSLESYASGVEKTADLSRHGNISRLPIDIEDQNETGEEISRYRHLRQRLIDLDNRRQQRRQRLCQFQELQRLLEPFKNPRENIQPNLVTRDGELFRELDKMRMLAARVGGRINQRKRKSNGHEIKPLQGFDQRLEALLEMT
ncbi:hypothetical protein MAP00_004996 [Monascus purpureus]|nr:hypothetical protein MAP00_004996 [Monascus purpureus]